MITHHTQLLNALIEKYNLKSYLEIGVQNPANNFDKIKAERKYGVDPEILSELLPESCGPGFHLMRKTSDEFFSYCDKPFDLVFIDGLHTAEQVKRDFENSLRCLSDNGFIVIHDVLPENEAGTKVPRETKQWWGDVYKWAMTIESYRVAVRTFNIDNGCMLVWKDSFFGRQTTEQDMSKITWDIYIKHRNSYMNVTSTVEI